MLFASAPCALWRPLAGLVCGACRGLPAGFAARARTVRPAYLTNGWTGPRLRVATGCPATPAAPSGCAQQASP
jgi:hypothetical protein